MFDWGFEFEEDTLGDVLKEVKLALYDKLLDGFTFEEAVSDCLDEKHQGAFYDNKLFLYVLAYHQLTEKGTINNLLKEFVVENLTEDIKDVQEFEEGPLGEDETLYEEFLKHVENAKVIKDSLYEDAPSEELTITKGDPATLSFLKDFASRHDITLVEDGFIGAGIPCVGFVKDDEDMFIRHNPLSYRTNKPIPGYQNKNLYPPDEVNAHTDTACLCVEVEDGKYDVALYELQVWVHHLESLGTLKILSYENEATGIEALLSGTTGYTIVVE